MRAIDALRKQVTEATAQLRARRIIAASGLFDASWYAEQAGMDIERATVEHYLDHGEPQGLQPNPLFDPRWYANRVKGARQSVLGPFAHFLARGAARGDRPHPIFDDAYLAAAPEAREHAGGVLGHYLHVGAQRGLDPAPWLGSGRWRRPVSEPPAVALVRRAIRLRAEAGDVAEQPRDFEVFDQRRTEQLLRDVVDPWSDDPNAVRPLVSIVLPTFDREDTIGAAIQSVRSQTYTNWELLVADDGSTDATSEVVAGFGDDRIRYLQLERGGVCRARNAGLAAARGDYIAYLDSDNTWLPRFLEVMVAYLEVSDRQAAHSALRYEEDGTIHYRGVQVDRSQLLQRNFIDCNTIVHRRDLLQRMGGWDEELRRTNDWDYVLRLSSITELDYVPYVGVDYDHDKRHVDRITLREPVGYRMKVRQKHLLDVATQPEPARPGSVTVIMVAEGDPASVAFAVQCVLDASAEHDLQLLVLDPAGKDLDTLQLATMEFLDPRVRVLRLAGELHRVIPRNAGLFAASGESVVFLDANVEVGPGWLDPLLDSLERGALAVQPLVLEPSGVVYSAGYLFPSRGLPYLAWQGAPEQAPWLEPHGDRAALSHHCLAIRRDVARRYGGFDPLFLTTLFDVDLCLRLRDHGSGAFALDTTVPVHMRVPEDASPRFRGIDDQRVFEDRWGVQPHQDEHEELAAAGLAVAGRDLEVASGHHRANVYRPRLRALPSRRVRWAIKIAPRDVFSRERWGDWHFAQALKRELEELGHDVVIDLRDAWYRPTAHLDDVVLCLRGVRRYEPSPDQINLMWLISHPEDVDLGEYERYDQVLVASMQYTEVLRGQLDVPVEPLLQCTDPSRFNLGVTQPVRREVLFVGNSRMIPRPIVRAAIDADLPLTVIGGNWDHLIDDRYIESDFVPNEQLPDIYRSAGVVLNDHWADMRRRGFLSNRLFDVAACGVPIVTDEIAGLAEVFGPAVRCFRQPVELEPTVRDARAARQPPADELRELAARVVREHSFAARARQLSEIVARKRSEMTVGASA